MKTIAQLRAEAAENLAKRSENYITDPEGTTRRAFRTMNSFYRLAGLNERLFYMDNNYEFYTRNRKYIEQEEKRVEKWINRIKEYFSEFSADIAFPGLYPVVIEKRKSPGGGIYDLQLTYWYN